MIIVQRFLDLFHPEDKGNKLFQNVSSYCQSARRDSAEDSKYSLGSDVRKIVMMGDTLELIQHSPSCRAVVLEVVLSPKVCCYNASKWTITSPPPNPPPIPPTTITTTVAA